ncbi:hypothetical protein EBI01_10355 [Marinomonas rhizomae]|uniref:Uncharacterized protein n=1 Tax=Marinomonas rhizomae TaxID=491948 RepID=A0A366J3W1_9GAMM|nr:hypothetical protein [Marinomonas rhizomae]RBP81723.1 hypothetical protein DFP80_10922 [Marinomonas rhizomae]RNF72852.1 hypothetical protein EBI01_10355 [Marinomonas rhizomae]
MYEEASNSTILMLLHTAVYPFLAALIVSIVAGKLLRASPYLGYLGGFIVGLSLIHSGLSFPPKQAIDYYTVTVLIGIASLYCLTLIKSPTLRLSVCFALFGLSFYFLLNPVLKHSGFIISLSWAAGCAFVTLIYLLINHLKTQDIVELDTDNENIISPQLLPVGLMISAGAAAPVISIGGSLLIGQLLGALGAALFGYVIISYLIKTKKNHSSIPAFLIFSGLISQSHILADIPLNVTLMLTASCFITPLATALGNKLNNKQSIYIIIVQIITCALISGLSLWLVWPESSLY